MGTTGEWGIPRRAVPPGKHPSEQAMRWLANFTAEYLLPCCDFLCIFCDFHFHNNCDIKWMDGLYYGNRNNQQ